MMQAPLHAEGGGRAESVRDVRLDAGGHHAQGSRFLLCQLSRTDPAFPKYPPQPVVRCDGYQPGETDEQDTTQGGNG